MLDEGKPGADEVRSEFTPPLGVELPPEPGPEGSAFTQPAQLTHPAFTPPNGIPLVSLSKETPWPDRMRAMLRMPVTERPTPEQPVAEPADAGPPVPRVLDLILRIGELLLAGERGRRT